LRGSEPPSLFVLPGVAGWAAVLNDMKNGDEQIPLDLETPDFIPEWLRSKSEFSPALAERFKKQGMRAAASAHQELLAQVKLALIRIARGRDDRCVTADDGAAWLVANGYSASELRNASGSLFKGGAFELVGFRQSERVSRHKNRVGIWRLKEGG
jgi:hypothetical protein